MSRQDHILSALRGSAGGSHAERSRALTKLNNAGYSDDEITDALKAEAVRLSAERERIDALNGRES